MCPKEGKVQAQAVCPRAFPFPPGLSLSTYAMGSRGALTDA